MRDSNSLTAMAHLHLALTSLEIKIKILMVTTVYFLLGFFGFVHIFTASLWCGTHNILSYLFFVEKTTKYFKSKLDFIIL